MRWSYLAKFLIKSVLVLVFVTLVSFSVLDRVLPPRPENPEQIQLKITDTRILITSSGQRNSSNGQVTSDGGGSRNVSVRDSNGPYYDVNEIDDTGEDDPNSEHAKNVRYHLRFWDLINATKSSDHVITTKPIFPDGKPLDYLWRPDTTPKELSSEKYSLVPQIVWEMEAPNTSYAENFETKTIVLWDGFHWWNKDNWNDPKQLISTDCEIAPNSLTKCQFSQKTDYDYLNSVHAVIAARDAFHGGPVEVPEHVLKFYFMLESPFHSSALLERSNDLIASYWRGSDVVTPYAKWVSYDLTKKYAEQEKNFAEGKTKTVAAFISNCDAWNDRMGFIKHLRKYIQVDVYGSCGQLQCARFGSEDCNGMLKRDYYFYLSFENSNCRDYVTEKLYTNGLGNDILPIVMGAHPDDYQALAPYKSYIHVEEFDSPKELGEYLHFLIQHPAEYNKYFEWKGTGEFVMAAFFCQMCAMVHYADLVPPPKRSQPYHWGNTQAVFDGMCLPKGRWYWTRENDSKKTTGNSKSQKKEKVEKDSSPKNWIERDGSEKMEDFGDNSDANEISART